MGAWYTCTFRDLLEKEPDAIASALNASATERRLDPTAESLAAWRTSVLLLRHAAIALRDLEPLALEWTCFLEFEIPRRRRRIDIAIIANDVIVLVECKIDAIGFDQASRWQAEQYALDIRDFHAASDGRTIIPILLATAAQPRTPVVKFDGHRAVQPVIEIGNGELAHTLRQAWALAHDPLAAPIDAAEWKDAPYRPTPTIVDAARMLYEQHDVREINVSGAQNLDATVEAVLELVRMCRQEHRRGIAFITGSPGSGKTLAGLQVVHTPELADDLDGAAVFLSGNMPLVEVISEALTISTARVSGRSKREVRREVSTFVQHAYLFRDAYGEVPGSVPHEHVILFDEAQRAWDSERVTGWTKRRPVEYRSTRSEPELFLDIMSRAPDWCVVIAMVGSGQEINTGEAGLSEWGRALERFHRDWIVRASPAVLPGEHRVPGQPLFPAFPESGPVVQVDRRLHLEMNVRSPRAEQLNRWVDSVLDLRIDDARNALPDPLEYPMAFTRSLEAARQWLRDRCDEDHRAGLLASAEARRLRHWGIETGTLRQDRAWADWFLKERGDVRSSNQLEVAATNFDCQGLEIDWAGLCWGNDFSFDPTPAQWRVRRFAGTHWSNAKKHSLFIMNGYRVILTRARRGQIIWVPQPDGSDPTLDPRDFDATADLLQAAGLPLFE